MSKPPPSPSVFPAGDLALAAFAAAMGHPARIAIVRFLLARGEQCCGEIAAELPLAQATVSQHLKALLAVGILSVRADGLRRCYKLEPGQIRTFCDAMQCTLGRKRVPQEGN
jgi:DNA-binding transcriptional ArsR family regulator